MLVDRAVRGQKGKLCAGAAACELTRCRVWMRAWREGSRATELRELRTSAGHACDVSHCARSEMSDVHYRVRLLRQTHEPARNRGAARAR